MTKTGTALIALGCVSVRSDCDYEDFDDKFLPYTDRLVTGIAQKEACERLCNEERAFKLVVSRLSDIQHGVSDALMALLVLKRYILFAMSGMCIFMRQRHLTSIKLLQSSSHQQYFFSV